MYLIFNRYEKNEEYILTKYQLYDCYEVDDKLANPYSKESIDFKYGLSAIDYLLEKWWNPDLGLPITDQFLEKEYFFHTVRSTSRQYSSERDNIIMLLHEAENIYKVIKNVFQLVNIPKYREEISNYAGIPVDDDTVQKIEQLLSILELAKTNGDLISCHFTGG